MFGFAFSRLVLPRKEPFYTMKRRNWQEQLQTALKTVRKKEWHTMIIGVNDKGDFFLLPNHHASRENIQTLVASAEIVNDYCLRTLLIKKIYITYLRIDNLPDHLSYLKAPGNRLIDEYSSKQEYKFTLLDVKDSKQKATVMKFALYPDVVSKVRNIQTELESWNTPIIAVIEIPGLMEDKKFNVTYTSDSGISRKVEPGYYESMTMVRKVKKNRKSHERFVYRELYCFNVGDDHLNISNKIERISEFKHILKSEMNQEYNNKADYISTHGAIIAEKCIEIYQDVHKAYQVCVIKQKQLIDPDFTETKWIDKLAGIRNFYKLEYRSKYLLKKDEKWLAAKKAIELLIECNYHNFMRYLKACINPSLPSKFGGLGITKFYPDNELTTKHLQNISFLWRYNKTLLYIYLKCMRRSLSTTEVIRKNVQHKMFLKEYAGSHRVPMTLIKKVIYEKLAFVSSLNIMIKSHKRSLKDIMLSTKGLVEYMWNTIIFDLNILVYNDESKICEIHHMSENKKIRKIQFNQKLTHSYRSYQILYKSYDPDLEIREDIYDDLILDSYIYYHSKYTNSYTENILDISDLSCLHDIPEEIEDSRYGLLNEEGVRIIHLLSKEDLENVSLARSKIQIVLKKLSQLFREWNRDPVESHPYKFVKPNLQ
jgi:hypothetical protein